MRLRAEREAAFFLAAVCDRPGIFYTWNHWKTVSIARAPSVALLDSFVDPKA